MSKISSKNVGKVFKEKADD